MRGRWSFVTLTPFLTPERGLFATTNSTSQGLMYRGWASSIGRVLSPRPQWGSRNTLYVLARRLLDAHLGRA